MCICVSLHMHLLCVGLRAKAGLCEWMCTVLCACVSERILCVPACVCPDVWSILLRHCDWLVPTVTALTDSRGRPLTSTIPHIRLAMLFLSSQLRIVSSLHILAFVFLSRSRIKKPQQNKNWDSDWVRTLSRPALAHPVFFHSAPSTCVLSLVELRGNKTQAWRALLPGLYLNTHWCH